jgi:hypothetical protein
MGEWVRDTSGTALKTTDAMLDRIGAYATENALLRLEIEGLKAELMVAVDAALVNR